MCVKGQLVVTSWHVVQAYRVGHIGQLDAVMAVSIIAIAIMLLLLLAPRALPTKSHNFHSRCVCKERERVQLIQINLNN